MSLKKVTKDYHGFSGALDRIISGLSFGYLGGKVRFRALNDINLECKPGEILGIIGRNGAGKSTLLKVITGVSGYDSGSIEVSGKVRSILELGVGFNPELSGEENVFYNGLVWGYSTTEIYPVMEKVFDFAGLQDFRNTPIKNYSSGMIMRLGFALATATAPEVLVVDEALAVGDASFQQKCIQRFYDFQKLGTTTIIVSHDLTLLSQLCSRIIVMEKGSIIYDGDSITAVRKYMLTIAGDSNEGKTDFAIGNRLQKLDWKLVRSGVENPTLFFVGDEVSLQVDFILRETLPQITVGFHLEDASGLKVFGTSSFHLGNFLHDLEPGVVHSVVFHFPLNIGVGKYSLGLSLHKGDSHVTDCYYWGEGLFSFEVERIQVPKFIGMSYLPVRMEYTAE
ncbi:ABC transporter ATP-binding protein [Leptospira sp. GIMC2001]|uniref:ABC transporter ATP-binding protein n=1 Tax=Leptospira sp. GIMC2001 TaxID=1513297 RepID=UPI002349F97B|nr:ABC transporter ATP-binding protein [Leptospira sp. GIMC2001]WCL51303.1 ABC transporter ATP-binding protein [Leptospira sp. GIMC2001]